MERPKYIAEGFLEDGTKLMNEFVQANSVNFSHFATVWRNHHFSLIFMGRPDDIETCEFTNEIFRICTHFLVSPSFYQKVGAVYLLYSLFRNQIASPPIKIRIDVSQWRIIKILRLDAIERKFRTLHYVIDYLIKNGFTYVAHQTLKGPVIGTMQKISKHYETVSFMKSNYKSDIMEYSVCNKLQELKDLHVEYLELKKGIDNQVKLNLNADSEVYDSYIREVKSFVKPLTSQKTKEPDSVGSRRAKLKAKSFITSSKGRFGRSLQDNISDLEENFEVVTKKKKNLRSKNRKPRHKRKVGRPSKKPKLPEVEEEQKSDDNIDIRYLLDQQQDFYLPPEEGQTRKPKCRPGRAYYKLSPKHADNNSSDSNDLLVPC